MPQILVIEDNEDIAAGLRDNLEAEGYEVAHANSGRRGLELLRGAAPDLLVLDLGLPDMDGHDVLRLLRREGNECPVLLLTARDAQAEKVLGFRLGADDYVTKPFGMLELLARVDALLRRARRAPAEAPRDASDASYDGAILRFGSVTVDRATRVVRRDGMTVPLAPKELDLLLALAEARGAVMSRVGLLRDVWGYSSLVSSRTVDSHIAQLRRKLESDPANPEYILTVLKSGYRLRL